MLCFRYGFSNMRYIASLISGVGIFMMGAGLSWYHGIMGLLHPQPIESLLWVSACVKPGCQEVLRKGIEDLFLSSRLTVFWQALWCQKEVVLTNVSFIILFFDLFGLKCICSCFAATLLVAINEIKKSARQNGLSFYEYGLYPENPFLEAINICDYSDFIFTASGMHVKLLVIERAAVFLSVPHLHCQPG